MILRFAMTWSLLVLTTGVGACPPPSRDVPLQSWEDVAKQADAEADSVLLVSVGAVTQEKSGRSRYFATIKPVDVVRGEKRIGVAYALTPCSVEWNLIGLHGAIQKTPDGKVVVFMPQPGSSLEIPAGNVLVFIKGDKLLFSWPHRGGSGQDAMKELAFAVKQAAR